MGSSKKHKKHKSERREKYDDRQFCLEKPPGLKLIFKVGGSNSTPEHGNDSPAGVSNSIMHSQFQLQQSDSVDFSGEYAEKHKKSKKKKKKKDREKRHKHHHKEKRRRSDREDRTAEAGGADAAGFGFDSSQEDISMGEDSQQQSSQLLLQETILKYAGVSVAHSLANSPVTKPMVPLRSPATPYNEPLTFGVGSPDPYGSARPSSASSSAPAARHQFGGSSPLHQQHLANVSASSAGSNTFGSPLAGQLSGLKSSTECLKSPASDSSNGGREPRSCVLKQKQSRSPLSKLLDHLLRALEKKDPHQFFAWPVTDDIAPGYSSIIGEPMDFLSIRQKVDDNEYATLHEFADDFRLMCGNAIKYNHVDTVYHKAAKRLLHVGGKMLQPEQLLRSLRPLMVYMRALTPRELGFDLAQTEHWPQHDGVEGALVGDSADEGMSTGAEDLTQAQQEEEEKRKNIRRINNPTNRYEPYVDDLTADEVLAQVQNAAKAARSRIQSRRNASRMGFLRQHRDGTTSMRIMVANSNDCPERIVSIGAFTGKLQQGTGQLQGFREDRRNTAKIVKPLSYGTFCSFAPMYDSRFANLSKEESELVLNTYGDETGSEYASSIMDFSRDSSYASTLANGLLDILTQGEHRKTIGQLVESQYQRYEQTEIERTLPSAGAEFTPGGDRTAPATVAAGDSNGFTGEFLPVDFDALRTLGDIGVDVSFLPAMQLELRGASMGKQLQSNTALIERLHQVQTERLSQPLPAHLSNVARPGAPELELATQLTASLTSMAKQLAPEAVVEPLGLRKAMGLSTANLGATNQPPNAGQSTTPPQPKQLQKATSNTDIIDMDLEPEAPSTTMATAAPASRAQADIENELRDYLDGGSTGRDNRTGPSATGTTKVAANSTSVLAHMMMH